MQTTGNCSNLLAIRAVKRFLSGAAKQPNDRQQPLGNLSENIRFFPSNQSSLLSCGSEALIGLFGKLLLRQARIFFSELLVNYRDNESKFMLICVKLTWFNEVCTLHYSTFMCFAIMKFLSPCRDADSLLQIVEHRRKRTDSEATMGSTGSCSTIPPVSIT